MKKHMGTLALVGLILLNCRTGHTTDRFEAYRKHCVQQVNSGRFTNRNCEFKLDLPSPFLIKCLKSFHSQVNQNFQIYMVSIASTDSDELKSCEYFFKDSWSPWREYVDYDFEADLPEELRPIYLSLRDFYSK